MVLIFYIQEFIFLYLPLEAQTPPSYFSNIIGKKWYHILIYTSLIASEAKHIFRYSLPTLFLLWYFDYLCSMTILPPCGTNFYWFIDAFYIVRLIISIYLIYIFSFFTFSNFFHTLFVISCEMYFFV